MYLLELEVTHLRLTVQAINVIEVYVVLTELMPSTSRRLHR